MGRQKMYFSHAPPLWWNNSQNQFGSKVRNAQLRVSIVHDGTYDRRGYKPIINRQPRLVRAAFLPAADNRAEPFVRAALRAAAERSEGVLRFAAARAWREIAAVEADWCPSCFRMLNMMRAPPGDAARFG